MKGPHTGLVCNTCGTCIDLLEVPTIVDEDPADLAKRIATIAPHRLGSVADFVVLHGTHDWIVCSLELLEEWKKRS